MNYRDWLQQVIYKIINPVVRGMIKIGITPNFITTTGLILNIVAAGIFIYCAASQVPGSLPACQTAGHEIPGNCPGTGHLGKNGRESDDQGHPPLEAVCKGKSLSLVVYRLDMFNDC